MGLDQYLSKKTYIGGNYEHNKVEGTVYIRKKDKELDISLDKITYIQTDAGYWRKANHIHKWFVDNIQEGNDDCKEYEVDTEQLKELLKLCKKVKSNPDDANKLLPCTEGFFFGSQEYDEYYFQDIDYTIEMLEKIILNHGEYDSYYYTSSW